MMNSFTEIEVNRKNEAITAMGKRLEAQMADAHFVCLKMASLHPFIFVR
jgi:hypothetical protein